MKKEYELKILNKAELVKLVDMYELLRTRLLKEGKSQYDQGVVDTLSSVLGDLKKLVESD